MHVIRPEPLTKAAFALFGDVIETNNSDHFMINNNNTERYHRLATTQLARAEDKAIISIFRAKSLPMPFSVKMMERHPQGSQAFIPLKSNPFLILAAPAGEPPAATSIRAFIASGDQGINYHIGVWHHPILCCAAQDDFLVVDREGAGNNCDEHYFDDETSIVLDPSECISI